MFNAEELNSWIANVGRHLDEHCSAYLIGGCAMCFKGLKPSTKDIDIIIASKKEFDAFDNAVIKAGFKRSTNMKDEFYLTALAVYEKEDSRIDVFLKEVGKMLKFASAMKQRAKLYKSIGNLKVYTASSEDIFLFKAMTSRAADINDCDRLMREDLNYDAIYEECMSQSNNEKKWYFWLYEKLCAIENMNSIASPIKSRVYAAVKENWKYRPSDFMSDIPNVEAHMPDKKLAEEVKRGGE